MWNEETRTATFSGHPEIEKNINRHDDGGGMRMLPTSELYGGRSCRSAGKVIADHLVMILGRLGS
jgi:hypothetical protein